MLSHAMNITKEEKQFHEHEKLPAAKRWLPVCCLCGILLAEQTSVCSGYLARAKTPRANGYGGIRAVYDSLYLPNIGLPDSACLSVGMGNVVTEGYSLSADSALCHILHLQIKCI